MQNVPSEHPMQIQRIEGRHVWIGQEPKALPLLLTPYKMHTQPLPKHVQDLKPEHLTSLIDNSIALLLVGTGAAFHPIPETLNLWCYEQQIGIEAMNSAAACRAFQLLAADERALALLLFPLEPTS